MSDDVLLLDSWISPYGARVRIALAEKDIKHEYIKHNLRTRSIFLLETNPVYKKIPVLIHNGKPVCESLLILLYLDEVWNEKAPFLTSDPLQRAQAMFWADYIDKTIYKTGKELCTTAGEEQRAAKVEFMDSLKLLEGELGHKPYFGGDNLGLVDIVLVPYYSWFHACETMGNFSIEAECPVLIAWAKRCMERASVSNSLPDPHKIYDFVVKLKKKYLSMD